MGARVIISPSEYVFCAQASKAMHERGLIQLRVIPDTGAERFAEYFHGKLNDFVQAETQHRVRVVQVEFREHEKNTAIYKS